jgi:hypothetical protein
VAGSGWWPGRPAARPSGPAAALGLPGRAPPLPSKLAKGRPGVRVPDSDSPAPWVTEQAPPFALAEGREERGGGPVICGGVGGGASGGGGGGVGVGGAARRGAARRRLM